MPAESEYMTVTEARVYLGVTKAKIAKLIAEGVLPARKSVLNGRIKLVKRADVEALAASEPRPKMAAPAA